MSEQHAPERYYQEAFGQVADELGNVRKRANALSVARIAIFLVTLSAFLWFANARQGVEMWASIAIGGLAFAMLVRLFVKADRRVKYLSALKHRNEAEAKGLERDFSAFDGGEAFLDPQHPYAYDLDLFGEGSVFQALNRTCTHSGRRALANWMLAPSQSPEEIRARQQAAAELAADPDGRQAFLATGDLSGEEENSAQDFLKWMDEPALLTGGYIPGLLWASPAIFWGVFLLGVFGVTTWSVVGLFFVVQMGIVRGHLKPINLIHAKVSRKAALLGRYAELLSSIERHGAESEALRQVKSKLQTAEGPTASERLRQAALTLERLDLRLNIFASFTLNPFLLWDLRQAYALERWRESNRGLSESWFEALGEWDALLSLSAWRFNRPDAVAPTVSERDFEFAAEGLGHPLLAAGARVDNDFALVGKGRFAVITGANMAGKSTFLRAVGVSLVLAQAGANVPAKRLTFSPVGLFTSMRTTDSLQKQESYFYAEISRLKAIVDRLEGEGELFVILDEMLKGTNSEDQRKGSASLLRKLSALGGNGLAATHDLALGKLAEEAPERFENMRFEAQIVEDELHFDYRLQPGVCELFNATFLMRKMGLTD